MFNIFNTFPELPYLFDLPESEKEQRIMQNKIVSLAQSLISKPSITPQEQGCCQIISDKLKALGFHIESMNKGEVSNFWAVRQTGSLPRSIKLVFAGHVDVVPPGMEANWITPAFSPVIKEGYLYGRGAADMKGSLAAMLVAVEKFIQVYPHCESAIGFMITSDEEGVAIDGTNHLVDVLLAQGVTIDNAIIGEPTSESQLADSIRIGRRGSINCKLTVIGKQGHVGYPQNLINPIHQASKLIHKLSHKRWDVPSRYFPSTSCQLVKVYSESGALNVTPASLEMYFNFRYSPRNSFASIKKYVEKKIKQYGLLVDLQWEHEAEPYICKRGKLRSVVQKVIRQETGQTVKLTTGGGISDGRFIKKIADQVIELGPSNKTIHQANERVSINELVKLADMYYKIMQHLLLEKH